MRSPSKRHIHTHTLVNILIDKAFGERARDNGLLIPFNNRRGRMDDIFVINGS